MKHINGFQHIVDLYEGFLLDVYGVLHNGIEVFPGTIDCLLKLKEAGKRVCLLTNTPLRRVHLSQNLSHLHGITPNMYDGIVTAGDSAHAKAKTYAGMVCYSIGNARGLSVMEDIQCDYTTDISEADFILNAVTNLAFEHRRKIKDLLRTARDHDIPMICSNPDLVVQIGSEQHICPGTYAKMYEELGGTVSYHGKPYGPVYREAQEILEIEDKSKIIATGDALHTDIQGANKFGVDSVLNMGGIHQNEISVLDNKHTIDPARLTELVDAQPYKPDYVLNGFKW